MGCIFYYFLTVLYLYTVLYTLRFITAPVIEIDSISDSTLVLPPPIPGQGRPEFPIPPPDEETGFLGPVPGTPQRPSGEIFPNKPPFYPFPISPSEVYEGSKYVPKEEVEGNTEGSSPVRPTWVPIPLPTNKPIYMPIYDPLAPVAPEIRTTTEYVPTPDYDRIFNIFNYEKDEPKRIRLSSSS